MDNLISVIIPTSSRNTGVLNNAVKSVKQQTLTVYEIIVVDDNNIQELSSEIVSYCHENKIKYIASGKVGAAAARNIGINAAKGNYIAFLDDDDTWLPNKLQLQMPLFTHSNVGLVYSRGYTVKIDDQGKSISTPYTTDYYYKTEVYYRDLLEKNYIGTTSQLVVKKSVLVQINGFDETLPSRQDYDLCLRISRNYRCLGVDDYLFLHYIHGGEQITSNAYNNMKGYQLLFQKYKSDICQVKDTPRKWYYRIMRYALANSSYFIFIKYLFLAIVSNPFKVRSTIKNALKKG